MTATATSPAVKQSEALDIFKKALTLNLSCPCIGKSKKLKDDQYQTNADKKRTRAAKTLLDSPEFQAVQAKQAAVKLYVYSRSVPSPVRAGFYLIPNDLVEEVDATLNVYRQDVKALAKILAGKLDEIKASDKLALGDTFNDADYPSAAEIVNKVDVLWNYVRFSVPDNLPENLLTREQEKSRANLREATDSIQQLLRSQMNELVSHLAGKLSGEKEGKPLIFRNSLIGNIREFLDLFNSRNIVNDTELEELCDKARALLNGVDPQALRDSSSLRVNVASGFQEIKAALDRMMVPAGTRAINFGGADED